MTMTRARLPHIGAGAIAQKPKNRGVYVFFYQKISDGAINGACAKMQKQYNIMQDNSNIGDKRDG